MAWGFCHPPGWILSDSLCVFAGLAELAAMYPRRWLSYLREAWAASHTSFGSGSFAPARWEHWRARP